MDQASCDIRSTPESDLRDVESDEFLDINEEEFVNEESWLADLDGTGDGSCNDSFKLFYSETDGDVDVSDLLHELLLLRCTSHVESNRTNISLIDSRTFTRPKKYPNHPPLTSIITNSSDDGRRGKLQRRLTTTITPTPGILSEVAELNKTNNRPVHNWEDGSEEGLADIENAARKRNRDSLPASILDRLQELKKSNSAYVSPRTQERNRQLNAINGNCDESENADKLNVRNVMPSSAMSDIFSNTPDYSGIFSHESLISLDDFSFSNPSNYSSLVREMENNEIFYSLNNVGGIDDPPLGRMTFGGMKIPTGIGRKSEEAPDNDQLLDIGEELNKTVVFEPALKINTTYELDGGTESNTTFTKCDKKRKSLVDVIMESDVIKNYNYKNCDNKDLSSNNVSHNFNETYTQNELNNVHSEKYTTKIFDATFKKISSADSHNGRKDSDHSEDDCMSTTSDNSFRSVDSSSELKNIEELKNIALQQNKKLSDVRYSTPNLDRSRPSHTRTSGDWRNFSPIEKGAGDEESQGSSNTSSRGASPRRSSTPSIYEAPKARALSIRPPPKVPQRELKLKPSLIRPSQTSKKLMSNGKPSSEEASIRKTECKTSASAATMPTLKQSITPLTVVSSEPTAKPSVRIPSGIPRPSSRLKQPQIRASSVFKK